MLNTIISILLGLTLIVFIAFLIKEKKIFFKYSTIFYGPLLIIMFVLLFAGLDATNFFQRLFRTISAIPGSFAFKSSFLKFSDVYKADKWFLTNYYFALMFIGFITSSMVIDIFFRQVINFCKALFIKNDTVVVLMEDDNEAKIFLDTCDKKYVLLNEKNKELEKYLLTHKITYRVGINEDNIRFLSKNKTVTFVSFLKDKTNMLKAFDLLKRLNHNIYFEINNNFSFAFEAMSEEYANINLFNKYNLISDDFIFNHSLGNYLDDTMIDRKTCLLKSDADIHMFMIGVGNVNKNLYLELIKNNQFAKEIDGKIETYTVQYELFNKEKIESTNLNHKLRRIRYVDYNNDDYYGWPSSSFEYNEHTEDISSFAFYKEIKTSLAKKGLNAFIVSLGEDLTNIDIALKLNDRLASWNLESKYVIYVRIKEDINLDLPSNIVKFGANKDVLSKDVIINERLLDLAKRRAALYANTSDIEENWKKLSLAKRLSNKNSVASIIHKYALLGLSIDEQGNSISKDEFIKLYDIDNEIKLDKDNKVIYPVHFSKKINPRNVLAYLEHNRWVVEMITKGFIPMKKDLVRVENGKLIKDDEKNRLHACITSFDGLDLYFDDVAKKMSGEVSGPNYDKEYAKIENKKYDYEIMDESYSLISAINYKINKK